MANWLVEAVRSALDAVGVSPADDGDGGDASTETDGGRRRASLYTCPRCEATYVARNMETCSTCDVAVEPIPNEYEVGIVSDAERERPLTGGNGR